MKPRILIAGIGNIFLGDDGFGVEVAQRLLRRPWPEDVRVIDFGIRGLDLSYALLDGYETVILIDAAPRGGKPGTLYLMEPDAGAPAEDSAPALDLHGMDPVKVLRWAESMGGHVDRLLLVGCEPEHTCGDDDIQVGMSASMQAAVEAAVPLIEALVGRLRRGEEIELENNIGSRKEVGLCLD